MNPRDNVSDAAPGSTGTARSSATTRTRRPPGAGKQGSTPRTTSSARPPAEEGTEAAGVARGISLAPPPARTSEQARQAAAELALSSGRRVDVPVRKAFVRALGEDTVPPLAAIYSGGRSGIVAVKLYLSLIWRCSGFPFNTDKPTRAWATLLDLPDPAGKGSRRISAALRTLADAQLITMTEQPGRPNEVTLLNEIGDGTEYALPSTAYQFAKTAEHEARNLYFKIPLRLWTSGELQALSGPATIMLLILLSEQADQNDVWWSTTQFPLRYRISHKTRADGTRELAERRLLFTRRESLSLRSPTSIFDDRRRRTIYRLFLDPGSVDGFFWQGETGDSDESAP